MRPSFVGVAYTGPDPGVGGVAGGGEILRPVRGDADGEPEARRGVDRQVVLADVDGVRAHEHGEIRPVVHDQRDVEPPRDLAGLRERVEQPAVRQRFLAQLDEIDAAAHGRLEEVREVRPVRRDQVQAPLGDELSHRRRDARRRARLPWASSTSPYAARSTASPLRSTSAKRPPSSSRSRRRATVSPGSSRCSRPLTVQVALTAVSRARRSGSTGGRSRPRPSRRRGTPSVPPRPRAGRRGPSRRDRPRGRSPC